MSTHPGSAGAQNELAVIVSDPARYKAEVERLTQLREEAESKLRAVSLESEADALRESAKKELSNASAKNVEAILQAKEIIDKAHAEASSIVAGATASASALKAEAVHSMNSVNAQLAAAAAARMDAEHLAEGLQAAKTEHENSAKAHDEAKKRHDIAAQLHAETRSRLEGIVKTISEVLK